MKKVIYILLVLASLSFGPSAIAETSTKPERDKFWKEQPEHPVKESGKQKRKFELPLGQDGFTDSTEKTWFNPDDPRFWEIWN